jgi:multicomponent Na+:H+ antiporter subunit A
MIALLVLLAVVGFGLIALGARLGQRAFLVGALPMAAALVWVVVQLPQITSGTVIGQRVGWVPDLGLDVDLRLDGLSATLALIVAGVGVAVMVYAACYFAADARDLGRLAGLLVLFCGSMLALVWADNVLVLYAGWELTSITSFLLIGNRHVESRARAAALHALLITSAGGLALLAGLLLLAHDAGTYQLSAILEHPPPLSAAVVVLLLVGAFTKSAQYPFHSWLPGAMAAPTPVSAYLHSATMVKAGVFLVAVLAPAFATSDLWRPLVIVAGCSSLVFGGLRALRQHDLKLLLAFGTVSQLGLLVVLFGIGTPAAATAGWVLLVAHAAFKATLFMVVGIIDHQTGTRDVRALPPLREGWRGVEVVTILAAASMAGLAPTVGFVAKELAYGAVDDYHAADNVLLLGVVVVGAMLTTAYAIQFYWGAFVAPRRRAAAPAASEVPAMAVSPAGPRLLFVLPAMLFAGLGLVLGVAPQLLDRLATASLAGYGAAVAPLHLALWHGFGLPLALSAVALVGGVAIAASSRRLEPILADGGRIPTGGQVYLAALHGLGRLSTRVTAIAQSGSLPVYAGVILLTAAAAPGVALLVGQAPVTWPDLGNATEVPIVTLLLVAAFGATLVRRRFAAALFLSVVGYAMAALFVASGAPDLALTQVTVETLSTVVFVLVLRRLPERFERQSTSRRRVGRVLIAGAVGATVFTFALVASSFETPATVSDQMVERAVPDGHGHNVVNVTLVDFRGFDTLGEITVLATASIGAVALARVARRSRHTGAPQQPAPAPIPSAEVPRLAFIDVSVKLAFPTVILMSLWLLFSGHDQPGGGFVGGLLAGSALTLRYIAGGMDEIRRWSRFRPWTILGTGLLIAAVDATVPIALGRSVLEVGTATIDLPVLGTLSMSSSLLFDTGVYLAVVGMVLMAFEAFGDTPEEAPT